MKKMFLLGRKAYWLFLVLILIVHFIGCKKDFLEAKSDRALALPVTLSDFQGLLDNLSLMTLGLTSPPLGEIASDGHYVTDAVFQNRTKIINTDAYIWSKTVQSSSRTSVYAGPYEKVLSSNLILEGLKKVKTDSMSEKERLNDIKGQALLQRARTYFELAQVYAPPYNIGSDNNDPGLVLRLSSDITIPSKRATVKQTYDQILDDLLQAKDLLPDRPLVLTRGSKSAAFGYLARVYLSMTDYANALAMANESLAIYSGLLNYNSISSSSSFIGRYNSEIVFHTSYTDNFLNRNSCLIERSFYDLYDDNDLRKTRFFAVSGSNITFKGNYDSTTSSLFSGLATDELYLIRAECYARQGKVSEAMSALNTLMRMRWNQNVPYPIITAENPDDALRIVLMERKKELILRNLRWSDLRRLNKDPRFAVTLTRTVAGVTYILEPNSYKYTFPIPDDIIEQAGITQNVGW